MIELLYNMTLDFIKNISLFWDFLTQDIPLSIDLGIFTIDLASINILEIIAGGLVGIALWWVIKGLVPTA